jgi:hypothetical protein
MLINTLIWPSVGADLSRTSPMYRPSLAFSDFSLNVLTFISTSFQSGKKPRGIEIRGHAEALPDGGQTISPNFSPALIRLAPGRIISWNLTSGDYAETHLARNV